MNLALQYANQKDIMKVQKTTAEEFQRLIGKHKLELSKLMLLKNRKIAN